MLMRFLKWKADISDICFTEEDIEEILGELNKHAAARNDT